MVKLTVIEPKLSQGRLNAYPRRFWKDHIESVTWEDGMLEVKLRGKPPLRFYSPDARQLALLLQDALTAYLKPKYPENMEIKFTLAPKYPSRKVYR